MENLRSGTTAQPAIRLRGLSKRFDDKQVLSELDLEVPAGQVLGYIGPNGAGKTTTVKILTGMLGEFEGSATVCGFDVRTQPLEVKRRIGYVPESAALWEELTARELLGLIGRIHGLDEDLVDRRAEKMLGLLDLTAALDDPLATFSKGMRQKVLLVSALLHDPQVIFLDEPLSGLDANTAVIIKEIMARLAAEGRTIFYCSHVMDVVERVCDRILILSQGRILADGAFEELQEMGKGESLERIFTHLTSAGGQGEVAESFVDMLGGRDVEGPARRDAGG